MKTDKILEWIYLNTSFMTKHKPKKKSRNTKSKESQRCNDSLL